MNLYLHAAVPRAGGEHPRAGVPGAAGLDAATVAPEAGNARRGNGVEHGDRLVAARCDQPAVRLHADEKTDWLAAHMQAPAPHPAKVSCEGSTRTSQGISGRTVSSNSNGLLDSLHNCQARTSVQHRSKMALSWASHCASTPCSASSGSRVLGSGLSVLRHDT